MNKKMRELLNSIEAKRKEARKLLDEKKLEEAREVAKEIDALLEEYDIEKTLFETEKKDVIENVETTKEVEETKKTVDGFIAMAKYLKKQPLEESEKALLGIGGTNGESNLIPEDIRLEIIELRKSYISAKDLLNVITTTTLSGSFNYETGENTGLSDITDGQAIGTGDVKFRAAKFTIKFKGKIIPISNILIGAEKASLLQYINTWFVRNAILTENKDIFATLKKSSAVKCAGWKALKKEINTLDPACKVDGVVVTSVSGFAVLDEEEDENGRPMLQENPKDPTQKTFQGLPVAPFPDAELPAISSDHFPMFVGSLKAGATFVEYKNLEFASSSDYLFNMNQTALRVIEGYDVVKGDEDAYKYIDFSASASSVG
jgi:HK97 family phage major capsid protein